MNHRLSWAFLCSFVVYLIVGTRVGGVGATHTSPATPHLHDPQPDGGSAASGESHQLRKRFIWTLTQEPYFYGKYGGGSREEEREQTPGAGSELLPEALALRNPTSMHKRLFPRWYQAYVYKNPSFNRVASPVGERKRFQPFHPLARFRGLALTGSSQYPSGYRAVPDVPLADDPGHRLPTAPNAQPSLKYEGPVEEEDATEEEDIGSPVKAGELLQMLKNIASDRGLSSHTKGFRFGISRRK